MHTILSRLRTGAITLGIAGVLLAWLLLLVWVASLVIPLDWLVKAALVIACGVFALYLASEAIGGPWDWKTDAQVARERMDAELARMAGGDQ